MINFLDAMRASREDPPSIWLQFTTSFRPGEDDIYVFFEGNADFSFYMPELRRRWHEGQLIPFKCKGKATVLGLIPKVTPQLDHAWRAMYFVDKDLDDFLGISSPTCGQLLETEFYSVENYLVSETMLQIVWTDLFHLPLHDPRLALAINKFNDSLFEFISFTRLIMSLILYYRKIGHRPNLANLKLEKLVCIDENCSVTLRNDWYSHFKSETPTLANPDWAAVEAINTHLITHHHKRYTRGKFEMAFFITFLNRLASIVGEKTGDEARAKIYTQFTVENAVEILAGRESPPPYLATFLSKCLPH